MNLSRAVYCTCGVSNLRVCATQCESSFLLHIQPAASSTAVCSSETQCVWSCVDAFALLARLIAGLFASFCQMPRGQEKRKEGSIIDSISSSWFPGLHALIRGPVWDVSSLRPAMQSRKSSKPQTVQIVNSSVQRPFLLQHFPTLPLCAQHPRGTNAPSKDATFSMPPAEAECLRCSRANITAAMRKDSHMELCSHS